MILTRQIQDVRMRKGDPSMSSDFASRFEATGGTYAGNKYSVRRSGLTSCLQRLTAICEKASLFVNLGGRELSGTIPPRGKIPQLRKLRNRNRECKTNSR